MKKLLFIAALLFAVNTCKAQNYQLQANELLAYNIGFGGFISGIGSAIHKHKNESIMHAFINGLWKGFIGGAINYEAKNSTMLMEDKLYYAWLSNLINATGTSIIDNGIKNESLLQNWQFSIGFVKYSTDNNIQLCPIRFAAFIWTATQYKFDYSKTLQTGKLYFKYTELYSGNCFTVENSIVINSYRLSDMHDNVVRHEFIHSLQEEQFSIINDLYKFNFIPKYIYMDVPCSDIVYAYENKLIHGNMKNDFELEAYHFSTHTYVSR